MTDVSRATIDFDHHSAEYAQHWREINAHNRQHCPVAFTASHGGFWQLSRYDDVAAVARDDAGFSSWYPNPDGTHHGATIPTGPMRQVPIEMDPPEFGAYRKLLNPTFSPATAARWEPYIRNVTTFCIDRFIESGECDLVNDLANPVPSIFTMELLGMPKHNWRGFSDATHAMVHHAPDSAEFAAALSELGALMGLVFEIVAQRRTIPTDDLISTLVTARIDGEVLSDERISQIITLVIMGGVDTTGSLLSSVLHWLSENPEVRHQLRQQPDLMPRAIEEFLRFFAPVQTLGRTATTDCVIGGQHLAAGERVSLSWSSANFDDTVFDNPEQLQLDRFPNRHQTFGVGLHRCLGSNFARTEFKVMLEEVLRRLPDFTVGAGAQRYSTIAIVNGWVNLPATFTPGKREGANIGV
jgi:cytochrome P450